MQARPTEERKSNPRERDKELSWRTPPCHLQKRNLASHGIRAFAPHYLRIDFAEQCIEGRTSKIAYRFPILLGAIYL